MVNRTTLLGGIVGKAAALEIIEDPDRERHMTDFLSLAAISRASDFRGQELVSLDCDRIANMLGRLIHRPGLVEGVPGSEAGLERLRLVLKNARQRAATGASPSHA
ncbi:hypothetical protein [Arthrobacter sp. M4]|uniref:hypothetical protein n=1 Tax=Arthrobacter sp. M4 TaxID=218160 RepID=UPI001CDC61C3|nr:hypothetical protein [Arthrobacter sp. M4]MCA4134855.1 hypothetical protein [Arthrobacter sp. M4]